MKREFQILLMTLTAILSCGSSKAQGVLPGQSAGATEIAISPPLPYSYSYGSIYFVSAPRNVPATVVSPGSDFTQPIPEPSATALFAFGGTLTAMARFKRRKK
jgi:hypothetical protein